MVSPSFLVPDIYFSAKGKMEAAAGNLNISMQVFSAWSCVFIAQELHVGLIHKAIRLPKLQSYC